MKLVCGHIACVAGNKFILPKGFNHQVQLKVVAKVDNSSGLMRMVTRQEFADLTGIKIQLTAPCGLVLEEFKPRKPEPIVEKKIEILDLVTK